MLVGRIYGFMLPCRIYGLPCHPAAEYTIFYVTRLDIRLFMLPGRIIGFICYPAGYLVSRYLARYMAYHITRPDIRSFHVTCRIYALSCYLAGYSVFSCYPAEFTAFHVTRPDIRPLKLPSRPWQKKTWNKILFQTFQNDKRVDTDRNIKV